MDAKGVIAKTEDFVKHTLDGAEAGHNWFHIERVRHNAMVIGQDEECDLLVVELAALLHDISDAKFNGGNENQAVDIAKQFLSDLGVPKETISQVVYIIDNVSFRSSFGKELSPNIELEIVQDADRLDAIGAVGIARCFHFGGYKNRQLFDPEIEPIEVSNAEDYKKGTEPSINHFFEKLLLIKDDLKTETGARLGQGRHELMISFLRQFFSEVGHEGPKTFQRDWT